jgi:TatA/E family protein of Tat protein translocase
MLSIPHLIIIFLVALVVFGPNKLPELARNLGRLMAEFRRATGDLRSTFDEHMRELEREAQLHELQKREAERTRQEAERRAREQSASPQLSSEQSALPGLAAGEPRRLNFP